MADRRARLLALVSYVLVAVLVVGPTALFTTNVVGGRGLDLPGTLWIHWWIRTTVETGQLPIATDLLFYPDGKNFFHDTGANFLDAWLGTPLQWLFGVPDFLDWLNVLLLVGNALAMQALAKEVTGGTAPFAAWAAALAFEVNPFVIQQLQEGRPTQVMLWFAPLAVRSLLRIPTGGWRDAAMFGVWVALQGLTYWFTVYFLALALLPLALVYVARDPKRVLPRLACSVGVAVAIVSPFLVGIALAIDGGEVRRLGFDVWEESPVAAGARWRLVLDQLASASGVLTIALGLYAVRRSWPLLVGALLAVVFSFGGRLDATLPPITNWLFVSMWETLPLLPRLGFPDRAAMATFLVLPLVAALGLARVDKVYAWIFAAVLVGEGFWRGAVPVVTTTYTFPQAVDHIRDEGGPVIYLPFGAADDAMVYQTRHGQPTFGGMGEREPDMRPAGYSKRLENSFAIMLGGTLNDRDPPIAYTREDREAIAAQFRWVWLDRAYAPYAWRAVGYDTDGKYRRLVQELGTATIVGEKFALWDLRKPIPAEAPGLGPTATRTGTELSRLPTGNLGPGNEGAGFAAPPGTAGGPRGTGPGRQPGPSGPQGSPSR